MNKLFKIQFTNDNILFLSIILFYAFVRLIFLDADPGIFTRYRNVGDEGYWAHTARNLVLYNQFITDDLSLDAAMAPLHTLSSFIFFKVFGVSTYSARLTSAVFGILTILLSFIFLKRYNYKIALWGTLLLSINHNYFAFNRMGLPETMATFFILLSFYVLEKNKFILAGVIVGLSVCAKISSAWFVPVFFIYLTIRLIKNEIKNISILHFVMGGTIIAISLGFYEYYYWDEFGITFSQAGSSWFGSGIINHVLQLPYFLLTLYNNKFLINPFNVLLVLSFFIYCYKIRILNIFSKNIINYLKSLNNLDVVILTWIIIYAISLLLSGPQILNDRRLQLLNPALSFVPAILLNNHYEKTSMKMNSLQLFILFIPLIYFGREIGHKFFYYLDFDSGLYFTILSFCIVAMLCFFYKRLKENQIKLLKYLSIFLLIIFMGNNFTSFISKTLQLSYFNYISIIIVFTGSLIIFFYYSLKNKRCWELIPLIGGSMILFELFTVSFSIKDNSKELNKYITENDYLIGVNAHLLSLNAFYHPLWWVPEPKIYGKLNMSFVNEVKPNHLIIRSEVSGKKTERSMNNLSNLWLMKDNLNYIGANTLERIYSFGLFPSFGIPKEKYDLYKINYNE